MNLFIQLFVFIPLLGFIISLIIPAKRETLISKTIYYFNFLHLITSLIFVILWKINKNQPLNLKEITIYKSEHFNFFIDFYFDNLSAVYLLVGSFITILITTYSRIYLHKEEGYKRYFNTIMFFFIGYNISILSGNFETLFLGWEILGLSSFLLITFYRNRYLPVSNGFKVYSYYRIGDIGLILAMWTIHHVFHDNITFLDFNTTNFVNSHLTSNSFIGTFIGICIFMSASSKSALLPFSSWIPRAMEGPTPSSAIFYGALSIHLGSFLLMRTYPIWQDQLFVKVFIFFIGFSTSIISYIISNSQSSIKAQIAYASLSQIGLNIILIALGFHSLALYHFAGNAFFRTYQLLVSPSIVSHQIRLQMYDSPSKNLFFNYHNKWQTTLIMLSLKDFQLDNFLNYIFWRPIKKIGSSLNFLSFKSGYYFFIPFFILHYLLYLFKNSIPIYLIDYIPNYLAFTGMISVFKAYSERKNPLFAWLLIVSSYFWICLATAFNDKLSFAEIIFYLSGTTFFGIIGVLILNKLKKTNKKQFHLNQFLGLHQLDKNTALMFLIAVLGVIGFPISPTFIGIDLIFSHIESNQFFLALFTSITFIVSGLAAIRIYSKLFLGSYYKNIDANPKSLS